jgi:hypothetical protein
LSCSPCSAPPHTSATCIGDACGAMCVAPFIDCDGSAADANGCEVDANTDPPQCA